MLSSKFPAEPIKNYESNENYEHLRKVPLIYVFTQFVFISGNMSTFDHVIAFFIMFVIRNWNEKLKFYSSFEIEINRNFRLQEKSKNCFHNNLNYQNSNILYWGLFQSVAAKFLFENLIQILHFGLIISFSAIKMQFKRFGFPFVIRKYSSCAVCEINRIKPGNYYNFWNWWGDCIIANFYRCFVGQSNWKISAINPMVWLIYWIHVSIFA